MIKLFCLRISFLFLIFYPIVEVSTQNLKAFYIGHSLSDQIPDMVKSLADDHAETQFNWVYQSIPGAPLRWQWQRKDNNDYNSNPPHYYGFYDQIGGLPKGDFDVLVLTESVPRHWTQWGIFETYAYADSFYVYAKTQNPNIKVYLYEDWHCILSGTPTGCAYDINSNPWRQRLTDDLPMWESVVDTLNKRHKPTNPVCLIPAGQGLARLYDSIQLGRVPEISSIEDLFSDDIHLTDIGKYFVACVHFGTLYGKSPVGLTHQTKVWWGGNFVAPSPILARKLQEIAWATVNEYPKSCVEGTSSIKNIDSEVLAFKLFPNPANNILYIDYQGDERQYIITNSLGNVVIKGTNKMIDLHDLKSGIYFIKMNDIVKKFIKI